MNSETKNLEEAFNQIFTSSVSGTGEEELLRLASSFSRQYSSQQIKALLLLQHIKLLAVSYGQKFLSDSLTDFMDFYQTLKQFNNSDAFVMRALDSISLRKFINENTMKINIEKK